MTILGVLGEASKLTDGERRQVTAGVIDAAGDLPICVGVTHPGTDGAVAFAREAQAMGAYAVMLAPPALAKPKTMPRSSRTTARWPTPSSCRSSCRTIRPAAASTWASTSWRIARHAPACRVIKLEEEPSPPKVGRLLAADPDLRILGGLGASMLLEELRRGAAGTMTGFGFPEVLVDIVGRYMAGDEAGAREVFHRVLPLIRFENQPGLNLAIRKHLYRRRGAIASERVRAPGPTLDPGTIADLDAVLAAVGLADGLAVASPG